MTQLTLNDEQSQMLHGASLPIVVFDSRGQIARNEGGEFYSTQEVLEHLRTLGGA